MTHKIKCLHERKRVSTEQTVPDYHPLGRNEIIALLNEAKAAVGKPKEAYNVSGIQCRLAQGIPGVVCPHEIKGDVADRMAALDSFFVENFHLGGRRRVVSRIMAILRG